MSLQEKIRRRGISEVVHFTTNRGLLGSLASRNLLSRPLLREDDYLRHVLRLNSSTRPEESALFDKKENWLRFVNLSISEVNTRFMAASRRWHTNTDVWWCILAFESNVMLDNGVWFATTNNGYNDCGREQGESGFDDLFVPKVLRKRSGYYGPWYASRGTRSDHLATCEQAEVLYPEKLSLDRLRTIYVEEGGHHDAAVGWLMDFGYNEVQVLVDKTKFQGRAN